MGVVADLEEGWLECFRHLKIVSNGPRLLDMRLPTFARMASSIGVVDVLAILTKRGTTRLMSKKLFIGHEIDVVICLSVETGLRCSRIVQDLLGFIGSRSTTEE
jgi:hypothetical protein